jgi:hypothetical protein
MPFQIITQPEIATGSPIDNALLGKVKGNLDEHETELTVLQTATPLVVIGTVVHSVLTLAQYQSLAGSGWVLAEGQSIVGSALHSLTGMTNAPDARGKSLRGKNNGASGINYNPDGDLALGSYQADAFASHSHQHVLYGQTTTGGSYGIPPQGSNPTAQYGTTSSVGGNETRMKNITTNIFIKIN